MHTIKRLVNGKPIQIKSRLVAKGFMQQEGIDYLENFFLVGCFENIRIILDLLACMDFKLQQMNVKTTFFNGE